MSLDYQQVAPGGRLAAIVRCVWTLRSMGDAAHAPQPIVPDGCIEIVLNLAAPFRRIAADGSGAEQPAWMVVGPSSGPTVVAPTGAVDVVGVRLEPWAGGVFGVPPGEMRDACVSLGDVSPRLAAACAGVLERAPSRESRVGALLRALDVATSGYAPPGRLAAAVARCWSGPSVPTAAAVAARLGHSVRSLERLFAAHVGLPPKTLARILRVQRAIREIERPGRRSWAAVAATVGYADQSHLVREMRRVAGLVPSELRTGTGTLTEIFLEPAPG